MNKAWIVGGVFFAVGMVLGGALVLLRSPAHHPEPAPSLSADAGSERLPPLFGPGEVSRQAGHALEFRGGQSVAIPTLRYRGDHPITLEARVVPTVVRYSTVIANFQHSGLGLQIGQGGHWSFVFHDARQYQAAASDAPALPGKPVHLAGCFDGSSIALFVDGELQSKTAECNGRHRASPFPLMIGADPNSHGMPEKRFIGAIDDVRVSGVARYTEAFRPPPVLEADEHTLGLWDFDSRTEVASDTSGNGHDGRIIGGGNYIASWILPVYFDRYERLRRVLTAARKTAGLSQEQLAEQMMRPHAFVAGYEAQTQTIGVVDLLHICDVLGVNSEPILWQLTGPDTTQREETSAGHEAEE